MNIKYKFFWIEIIKKITASIGLLLIVSLLFAVGCDNKIKLSKDVNSIGGSNPFNQIDHGNGDGQKVPPEDIGQPSTSDGIFNFSSAINQNTVWVVTNYQSTMRVHLVSLKKDQPSKIWVISNAGTHGARTYVSEIGLLIGKIGGKIYRIDPNYSQNYSFKPVWQPTSIAARSNTRPCPVSFKIDGNSYMGFAWERHDGHRLFTRIPIDFKEAEKFDFTDTKTVDLGKLKVNSNYRWGYSCYIDQKRNYFWSGWLTSSFFGVNVETMVALSPSVHPTNARHFNSSLGEQFLTPSKGISLSYAFAGGIDGAILTGKNMYTYTHDTRYGLVYGSHYSSKKLLIARENCFTQLTDCTGNYVWKDLTQVGHIKPMSALNDGRIVGIVRGRSSSQIYVIEPSNPKDLNQDIVVTRIAEVKGDAYMYNDFTGGTLFAKDIDLVVDLTQLKGWSSDKSVESLSFTWTAQAGGFSTWRGLNLNARCYKEGDGEKPALTQVTNIKDAGQTTAINVPSCTLKTVDRLELQLRSIENTVDFTRTSQIKIMGIQR